MLVVVLLQESNQRPDSEAQGSGSAPDGDREGAPDRDQRKAGGAGRAAARHEQSARLPQGPLGPGQGRARPSPPADAAREPGSVRRDWPADGVSRAAAWLA